jgi:hypothetical protein
MSRRSGPCAALLAVIRQQLPNAADPDREIRYRLIFGC